MKRRNFLIGGAALGGASLMSGLSGRARAEEPVRGGTLTWGHSETTQNLDIHQTGTASTHRVLQNVHNAIVGIDKDLKVVPMLAESFEESEDGLTYTFRLRRGVKFHDGSEMTSEDVKYSFERCMNPDTGAVHSNVFNAVESIETPDEFTVVVRLSQVNAPFVARLANNAAGVVIPKDSGDLQGETPVGCGPFRFAGREFGNTVELQRFDEYWDGPAYLDKIVIREVTEPTVRLTGLRMGEFDLINDIPADRIAEIRDDANLQAKTWFPLNFDYVNLNHNYEPFKNPKVREAFDLTIDKEALLQGALWGEGETTATPSFPTSSARNNDLVQRGQDFEKAAALLKEAGYGPGDLKVEFKVTTNYPYHVESAQILLEWLRAAGVDATITQLTWSDWLSQVWVNRDFQVTMMNFFTLWEPDHLYYSLWNSKGGFNYRGVADAEIDEMTEKARLTVDPAERDALYKAVQQRIFDETHDIVLWFRNGSLGAQPRVMGLEDVVHPNGSNLVFHKVWLSA